MNISESRLQLTDDDLALFYKIYINDRDCCSKYIFFNLMEINQIYSSHPSDKRPLIHQSDLDIIDITKF